MAAGKVAAGDDDFMPGRRTPIAVVVTTVVVVAAAWMSWFAGGLTFADAAGDSYLLTNSAQAVTFTAFGAARYAFVASRPAPHSNWTSIAQCASQLDSLAAQIASTSSRLPALNS